MGRPKPLLAWRGVTLIEYQIASLTQAGVSEVVVVLGHGDKLVAPHVRRAGVRAVFNPLYRQGRTTSIKAGLGRVDVAASAIMLLAVDQPRPAEIIAAILDAHQRSGALLTSPRYRGRGGHPVVFDATLRPELASISEEGQGIREVFEAHRDRVTNVIFDDPIVRLDLNSRQDYTSAVSRYGDVNS